MLKMFQILLAEYAYDLKQGKKKNVATDFKRTSHIVIKLWFSRLRYRTRGQAAGKQLIQNFTLNKNICAHYGAADLVKKIRNNPYPAYVHSSLIGRLIRKSAGCGWQAYWVLTPFANIDQRLPGTLYATQARPD
uniref:Uncharacterized protein n=1 Tax=Glossina palpalis gambiensis TaxID=67801 RepID=A0A1B0AQ68_9MUSC